MSELHARLLAAVRQRMDVARAATPGPWDTSGPDTIAEWSVYAVERGWMVASACVNDYPDSPFPKLRGGITGDEANRNAAFIAANDPATVLRHCERDLRVVERHAATGGVCPQCAADQRVVEDAEDEATYWEFRPVDWPCDEITDLAAAYGIDADG